MKNITTIARRELGAYFNSPIAYVVVAVFLLLSGLLFFQTLFIQQTAELRELFREKLSILKLGLENRLTDRIGLLSGGQRQAVSLLMATLAGMQILLLDEHIAALDPRTAEFVLGLTNRIVKQHRLTAVMVTHSMRHALDHGSRTVMLHEGRVVFDVAGAERDSLDVPNLLALFARVRGGEQLSDDSLLLG